MHALKLSEYYFDLTRPGGEGGGQLQGLLGRGSTDQVMKLGCPHLTRPNFMSNAKTLISSSFCSTNFYL